MELIYKLIKKNCSSVCRQLLSKNLFNTRHLLHTIETENQGTLNGHDDNNR